MDDLISRQATINTVKNMWDRCERNGNEFYEVLLACFEELPTAEPRKGKWRDTGSGQECSVCREIQYGYDSYRHYCANCGARMEESDET